MVENPVVVWVRLCFSVMFGFLKKDTEELVFSCQVLRGSINACEKDNTENG